MVAPCCRIVLACALIVALVPMRAVGGSDSFAILHSMTLDSLDIDSMIVDARREVVMFDCSSGRNLRFLEVDRDRVTGEFSFNLAEDELPVSWNSPCKGWLLHDTSSGITYVLSKRSRSTVFSIGWDQVWISILGNRQFTDSILVNPEGGVPSDGPVDFRYAVSGFALKPIGAEVGTGGRIIIDDTVKGNIDIVDLSPTGLAASNIHRHDYRERIDCDWPPEDPSPWSCNWNGLLGNSLALEWRTETAFPSPGLTDSDELYLLDPNGGTSIIRRLELSQPPGPTLVGDLPSLDITEADPFLANGAEGLTLAPAVDSLYVSTRLQSFAEGWLVIADTATQQQTLVDPVFSDEAPPVIDRADPDRAFLLVSDSFVPGAPLFLRVLRGGQAVDSVTVLDSLPPGFPAIAHDPLYGLLYVVVENQLVILQGTGDLVFDGSFELR